MKKLLEYLFDESQTEIQIDDSCSVIEEIMEAAEQQEPIKAERTPLVKALKALKLEVPDTALEYDNAEGFILHCDNEADYRKATSALSEPEAMEELAKLGWVALRCGDTAMSNEAPDMRIRFLEITTCDADDKENWPAPNQNLIKKAIEKGREFVNEPFDRDEENPVEDTDAPNKQNAGVSKAQPGKDPEGKPKTGKSKTESEHLVTRMLDGHVQEGGHKPGCGCGFCKNKGKGFGKKKSEEDGESSAPTPDTKKKDDGGGGVEHTFEAAEPARYDDVHEQLARRRGHPKTPVKDKPVAKAPRASAKVKKAYKTPRK